VCVRTARDLRIDFFRGLALIIIFVDHVPGNLLSRLTPKNFGFSNAADIFVLLAGMSAALAYFPVISAHGLRAVIGRLVRRIAEIYTAHVVVLWASIVVLSIATGVFHRVDFMGHEIPAWVPADPWRAAWSSLALKLQPEYLDILPLYVVLLLSVPLFIVLESVHRGTGLLVSLSLWLVAEITGLNFPSSRSPAGWYFDPFVWQVLFCIGLVAGIALQEGVKLPRSWWLIVPAVGYVLFAFVATAPCQFRVIAHLCQIADHGSDIAHLTPWRIAHILALAYLVTVTVPLDAAWLSSQFAQSVVLLGRNSLPVFLAGVIMALLGSIMLVEYGAEWQLQFALNAAGACALLLTAAWSDRRRGIFKRSGSIGRRIVLSMSLRETAAVLLVLVALAGYALFAGGAVAYWALAIVSPTAGVAAN
jgi:hypothetical protein